MKIFKPPLIDWLLEQIELFLDLNDMEPDGCQFGYYIMNDRTLVSRIRDGGDVTTKNMECILTFMQTPATVIHRGNRKGELKPLTHLKPLNIQRRTIP